MIHLLKNNKREDKINEIVDLYNKILDENNNKTSKVMILVPNSSTRLDYIKRLKPNISEEIKIITYMNFIKGEIARFWPIINTNCDYIKTNTISPTFISNSLSQYIINDRVNKKRNLDGYFMDITSSNKNIANNISLNINKGSQALIDFKTIGEKLYLSKKNKDDLMRYSYTQMDEIIDYYIKILLENSILDDSMCIYAYNNFLLNNEIYNQKLSESIDYLIVESLENSTTAEVDFIDILSKNIKEIYLYFNKTRDYSVFNNIDMEYIKEKFKYILKDEEKITLDEISNLGVNIHLNEDSQLYSEMITNVSQKIIELVNSGAKKEDIAIISPINNNILDYQVNSILNKHNIEVFNTKKDMKLVDYPYMSALVVATCILYDCIGLVKDEEHISFIEILFEVNRIEATRIYRHKEVNEKYQDLVKYIYSKRDEDIRIYEFLNRFYIDKMLNLKYGKENVKIAKTIIRESEIFVNNIEKLKLTNNKEKIFVEALKTTINDFYSANDIDTAKKCKSILITTPYAYISHNINRPIQIWTDIGSNTWNMKIEKEISNLIVLRKSYKEKKVYNDYMEENYKKYYLYNMMYNLLIDAKQVYTYKSEYTLKGYIEESILYSLLLKLVDRG